MEDTSSWTRIPEEVVIYNIAPYLDIEKLFALSMIDRKFIPIFVEGAKKDRFKAMELVVTNPTSHWLFDKIATCNLSTTSLDKIYNIALDTNADIIIDWYVKNASEIFVYSLAWYQTHPEQRQKTLLRTVLRNDEALKLLASEDSAQMLRTLESKRDYDVIQHCFGRMLSVVKHIPKKIYNIIWIDTMKSISNDPSGEVRKYGRYDFIQYLVWANFKAK